MIGIRAIVSITEMTGCRIDPAGIDHTKGTRVDIATTTEMSDHPTNAIPVTTMLFVAVIVTSRSVRRIFYVTGTRKLRFAISRRYTPTVNWLNHH